MSDFELLILAAEAAGIECGSERLDCGLSLTRGNRYLPRWNSLHDDGDALRLRNILGLVVVDEGDRVYVENMRTPGRCVVREPYDRDLPGGFASPESINKAVRRAITRAAAGDGDKS